jgi:hypothetical protein
MKDKYSLFFFKKISKEEMMQIMKRELVKMRENGSNHVESIIHCVNKEKLRYDLKVMGVRSSRSCDVIVACCE